MNNRRIEYYRLNGIKSLDVMRPSDMILTIGRLDDVCESSIEHDRLIAQLTNRIAALETTVRNLRDSLTAVVNQFRIPTNRR